MSKRAIEQACDYIVRLDSSIRSDDSDIQAEYCKGNCEKNEKSYENCMKCALKYFNDGVISDGGDVVKEIYNLALCHRVIQPEDDFHKGYNLHAEWLIGFIKDKLQGAGIEVDDVNRPPWCYLH